jgi:hypothetical protein
MKKYLLLSISFFLFTFHTSAWANEASQKAARQVIENWFAAMKSNDTTKAGTYLSPKFVSIHTDGLVRDKEQELKLIKNLHMKSYQLTDFQYSEINNTIIVTYKNNGAEKIDNKSINAGPAGRMAILQKENNNWQIIAYANLDKIS